MSRSDTLWLVPHTYINIYIHGGEEGRSTIPIQCYSSLGERGDRGWADIGQTANTIISTRITHIIIRIFFFFFFFTNLLVAVLLYHYRSDLDSQLQTVVPVVRLLYNVYCIIHLYTMLCSDYRTRNNVVRENFQFHSIRPYHTSTHASCSGFSLWLSNIHNALKTPLQ